ncbi:hypothetical protein CC78DRAFT_202436 [Lojkania enalia]|uniref:Uncharacterized protein n=1 Tax=Lojkania enalia TaxID=147567 RepID=A0A9P4KAX0_9PLEO|nr:hypothetical protein CC78DRAFT_202436 [Didymosphaeria enalia]
MLPLNHLRLPYPTKRTPPQNPSTPPSFKHLLQRNGWKYNPTPPPGLGHNTYSHRKTPNARLSAPHLPCRGTCQQPRPSYAFFSWLGQLICSSLISPSHRNAFHRKRICPAPPILLDYQTYTHF